MVKIDGPNFSLVSAKMEVKISKFEGVNVYLVFFVYQWYRINSRQEQSISIFKPLYEYFVSLMKEKERTDIGAGIGYYTVSRT